MRESWLIFYKRLVQFLVGVCCISDETSFLGSHLERVKGLAIFADLVWAGDDTPKLCKREQNLRRAVNVAVDMCGQDEPFNVLTSVDTHSQ
jgi:hypothetical protein